MTMFYVVPVYDSSLNEFCFCDILHHTKPKCENPIKELIA